MKKLGFMTLLLAIALMLGGNAFATGLGGDFNYYFTTYYSNANTANAPDATVRIINDGYTTGVLGSVNLWADIYVFDDSEELTECCSCMVTADGLLSESVNKNLTANPITDIKPTRGVIKVIASAFPGASTDWNGQIGAAGTGIALAYGLHGWATHVQKLTSGFAVSETPFANSNLTLGPTGEQGLLENLCLFDGMLSGKPCTCTPEDQDF